MPVELRKRVAKAAPPAPEPPKKKAAKAKPAPKAAEKEAAAPKEDAPAEEKPAASAAPAKTNGAASKKPAVGDTVDLTTFGGTIQKHSGDSTTLASLATASTAGVVLFTYPKASTPGCTTQVCLFRDAYDELTAATGFAIYGLSRDSPKSNTTFATKQKLPYDLLCDPKATLISAIGLAKAGAGTQRGVFVVDKAGKVLVAEAGGPAATLAAVKKLVVAKEDGEGTEVANGVKKDESKEKKVEEDAEKKAEEVEEKEEKANGGATEEDKEVEKTEAEGI